MHTITDLTTHINDHLVALGVDPSLEELEEAIREHRVVAYEEHDARELGLLLRRVWGELTEGAEWPLEDDDVVSLAEECADEAIEQGATQPTEAIAEPWQGDWERLGTVDRAGRHAFARAYDRRLRAKAPRAAS